MKKIIVSIIVVVVCTLGVVGGYLLKNDSSVSAVLSDGDYTVTASWNWKKLNVSGEIYTLDDSRKYEVLAQNNKNGIIVINAVSGMDKKTTQVYKIIKSGNNFEWYAVANGEVSEKAAATVTKK